MYTSQGGLFSSPSTIMPSLPLDKPSRFSLDTAGVASLFGGEDAVSAMAAIHIYRGRRWVGWFNHPGSFQIAKRLNSFAKSVSSSKLSGAKSVQADPAVLVELDGYKGPKFRAAQSGTIIEETGYPAALFMNECAAWNSEGIVVPGRRTQPVGITIADLGKGPAFEMRPARSSVSTLLFAGLPIIFSVGTCAISAIFNDLYAATLILIGIAAGGISGLVLGSADFVFTHPEPARGSPAGDGILTSEKDIVLLRGTESAVNSITRGSFSLRFSGKGHFDLVWWCSALFFIQCITQLFLIPQATLFGQIMFLASLAVSALYNAQLSSLDKEKIHRKMLFAEVLQNPTVTKYTFGTRTTAVVFILLVLQPAHPAKLLDDLLPNDIKVWKHWKATILEWLRRPSDQLEAKDLSGLTQQEKDLLGLLLEDARTAYSGYSDYLGSV